MRRLSERISDKIELQKKLIAENAADIDALTHGISTNRIDYWRSRGVVDIPEQLQTVKKFLLVRIEELKEKHAKAIAEELKRHAT